MLELYVVGFTVIVNLILAVLVFAQNTHKEVNRYFSLFAIALVGWSVTNYISVNPIFFDQLFWIRLDMAWAVFMSMAILLLTNVFPTNIPYYSRTPKWAVIAGVFLAIASMSPWLFTTVDYSSGQAQPVPGPLIVPFALYSVGALGLSGFILIRRFFTLKDRAKEYVRYALVGIVSMFAALIFFNFVLVVVFHNTFFVVFTPAFVLLFSASFAYGMMRRQLFDVRLIVARFIAYLLLLIVAGSLYSFTAVLFSFFVTGVQPNLLQTALSTSVVGILILFVQPLRRFLNKITRAIFYQDAYDTKDVLDHLSSVLVRSIDTGSLVKKSTLVLKEALKSENITFILTNASSQSKYRVLGSGERYGDFSRLLDGIAAETVDDVYLADTLDARPDQLQAKLRALDVAVMARLEASDGIIGYWFFGDKTSGTAYSKRDIDLIRIAGDELAVAIQNAIRFDEIQAFNETLQERIQEATKELRTTNSQLQRLDEAKDEFISMASHQLRTPLTSVKGYISMVLEEDAGKITGAQRQLLDEAFASSERMVHLINDFLNVSRLQTGKFMLEQRSIDLSKVVAEEVDSLQSTVKMHALKIKYKKPSYFPLLLIDEAKIRQVIMNFIDNAIYYSLEGTTITVTLAIEDAQAVVRVTDMGIGVPQNEQQHLFSKFFRATNARKQRPDGTGVGLFLAKKVIDAHGGSIVFESTEGKGSTFGFRLPIKKLTPKDADGTK
ncbi:MAG TPA: ATP-binding protein [Candidatus Saccharimonadales bacterium]|nr:ATP-binding protein [Candidatus Saccharimonadales bacterium]